MAAVVVMFAVVVCSLLAGVDFEVLCVVDVRGSVTEASGLSCEYTKQKTLLITKHLHKDIYLFKNFFNLLALTYSINYENIKA